MTAKQGQMRAVIMMAQDLIKTRNHMIDLCKLKSELCGVSYTIQTSKSTQAMGDAMEGIIESVGIKYMELNLQSLQKSMQELERQKEKMEQTSELMADAIDDPLEGDEEEEETEERCSKNLHLDSPRC
ncbi:Charged multivesicular body protein 2A [Orobanche minor]